MIATNEPKSASEVMARVRETKRLFRALNVMGIADEENRRQEAERARRRASIAVAMRIAKRKQMEADQRRREIEAAEAGVRIAVEKHRDVLHMASSISPASWLRRECTDRGFDIGPIIGGSRKHAVVVQRHALIFDMKEKFPALTLNQIGRMFGGLDHTTIIASLRKEEKRREAKP